MRMLFFGTGMLVAAIVLLLEGVHAWLQFFVGLGLLMAWGWSRL